MKKTTTTPKLLDPIQIGDLSLKNRVVMAPLTRCRADPKTGIPNDLMKEHYTQRSSFGLIITECAQISDLSLCFPGSGGIYTENQAQGWKKIVESVHKNNGKIFLQLWHCGRACPKEQSTVKLPQPPPLSPSETPANTPKSPTQPPKK